MRKIDTALELSWLRSELAPHYSSMGRPSIDPELMIRMLIVGYVFAIRSERLPCREVQVTLPIAGSANSALKMPSRTIQRSRVPATSAFVREMFSVAYLSASSRRVSRPVWLAAKALQSMRA